MTPQKRTPFGFQISPSLGFPNFWLFGFQHHHIETCCHPENPTEDLVGWKGHFCQWFTWVNHLLKLKSQIHINMTKTILVGGWTTPLKNMLVNLGIFPKFRGEHKNLWVATTQYLKEGYISIWADFFFRNLSELQAFGGIPGYCYYPYF